MSVFFRSGPCGRSADLRTWLAVKRPARYKVSGFGFQVSGFVLGFRVRQDAGYVLGLFKRRRSLLTLESERMSGKTQGMAGLCCVAMPRVGNAFSFACQCGVRLVLHVGVAWPLHLGVAWPWVVFCTTHTHTHTHTFIPAYPAELGLVKWRRRSDASPCDSSAPVCTPPLRMNCLRSTCVHI